MTLMPPALPRPEQGPGPMFHAAMQAAIEDARTLAQMDELSRQVWQGHGSGALGDEEAQSLAERLHGRRSAIREGIRPVGIPAGRASLFPPRQERGEPRSGACLATGAGCWPAPALCRLSSPAASPPASSRSCASSPTRSPRRALCGLCIDAIAARAGVCRRLAQAAIRLAEGDGLLDDRGAPSRGPEELAQPRPDHQPRVAGVDDVEAAARSATGSLLSPPDPASAAPLHGIRHRVQIRCTPRIGGW